MFSLRLLLQRFIRRVSRASLTIRAPGTTSNVRRPTQRNRLYRRLLPPPMSAGRT